MCEPIRGKLIWQNTRTGRERRVVFPTRRGGQSQPTFFNSEQLAKSLNNRIEEEIDVDLELETGRPVRIRPVDEPWQEGPRDLRDFRNPYNFVPSLPRDHLPAYGPGQCPPPGGLGDEPPIGHECYHGNRVSGEIRVKMTVITPMLLPDAARACEDENGHKSFPVRTDADGKPYVPSTSVKGMLRAAYEAVTNSRLAVFAGHEDRLGRRMLSNEGLGLVPCRIEGGNIRLLPGCSAIAAARPVGPMYAAWLPRKLLVGPLRSPFVPNHRDAVSCWIELWERTPWNRHTHSFQPSGKFQYWRVLRVGPPGACPSPPGPSALLQPANGYSHHTPVPGVAIPQIQGFACITGYNFDRKYNERVFFEDPAVPPAPRTSEHDRLWRNLISDYRTNQDLQQGRPRPSALQEAGWSRHMTDDNERELSDGTLAYALVEPNGPSWRVVELFPVCIARRLFAASPEELLDESLQPAYWIDRLSPADRVFGWVRQTDERRKKRRLDLDDRTAGITAYRGNVRVGPVACESSEPIESFGSPGLPLAILGQPKPQQARFYVAASAAGNAQQDGLAKEKTGYECNKGLRGRKVYPHQRRAADRSLAQRYSEPHAERCGRPFPRIPSPTTQRRRTAG